MPRSPLPPRIWTDEDHFTYFIHYGERKWTLALEMLQRDEQVRFRYILNGVKSGDSHPNPMQAFSAATYQIGRMVREGEEPIQVETQPGVQVESLHEEEHEHQQQAIESGEYPDHD